MTTQKLNVLLAKTDHLASVFKNGLVDYVTFFKKSQGAFKGEKKTYEPFPGTVDYPNERANKLVVTTVDEKLKYLEESSVDYIDALFAQEKTNATGSAKANLVVDGKVWGEYSTLELLRLKTLLENTTLKELYENIPVRNDDEIWNKTSNEMYANRNIWESGQKEGLHKTTVKESYILPDPNISKVDGAKYTPQLASKDTIMELGKYTHQRFSGEASHTERAYILNRRSKLLTAVIEALKVANEAEVVASGLTAQKIFNYLHRGA